MQTFPPGTHCLSPGLQTQAAFREWAGDSSHKILLWGQPMDTTQVLGWLWGPWAHLSRLQALLFLG